MNSRRRSAALSDDLKKCCERSASDRLKPRRRSVACQQHVFEKVFMVCGEGIYLAYPSQLVLIFGGMMVSFDPRKDLVMFLRWLCQFVMHSNVFLMFDDTRNCYKHLYFLKRFRCYCFQIFLWIEFSFLKFHTELDWPHCLAISTASFL